MFDTESFSHFLSYGATDQQTARELREVFDGLVVPGTIAAFQHQGTGGFVLTLSATVEGAPYIIDPRFPLFQQALRQPKKSHISLANALGDSTLIRDERPTPADFTDGRIRRVAANWVKFNKEYRGTAGDKFAKYEKRLDEPVTLENAREPEAVLAPYFVCSGVADPWWQRSIALFEASKLAAGETPCIRVIAASNAESLLELVSTVNDAQAILWVSDLNEISATPSELRTYLEAISAATTRGTRTFALYGGFFAVLARSAGLNGTSHGIGFGEYRDWVELPRSGPPPARYYLPAIHRYVPTDDAEWLSRLDESLTACECDQCDGKSPNDLDYHELMKHSVECRSREISEWAGMSPQESAAQLTIERNAFVGGVQAVGVSDRQSRRVNRLVDHLPRWAAALDAFGSD